MDAIRAITEEKREELHDAHPRDRPVYQALEAIQRIDRVRLEERVQHARTSDHEEEPDERKAEEEHQREDQRFNDHSPHRASTRARIQRLSQRRCGANGRAQASRYERRVQEDKEQDRGRIGGPTQRAAPSRRDSHVVHLRGLGRTSVPPLAGRHRLAAGQRGGVTELGPIAHGRVDVEHAPFADEHVPAEGHRSDLDSPGLCPVAVEERLFADHRPCVDRQEIGTYRHTPGEDHGSGPDFRAQRLQIEPIQGRTDEQAGGRARPDERLDDPEADVGEAPQADMLGLPAADERPLRGDRNGVHNEKSRAAGQDQPQIDLEGTRSRRDPLVALRDGDHRDIGIREEKQRLERSAEDVLPCACRRRRLDRRRDRRLGRPGRHVHERRCQASDRRMPVDVPHRYRRQVTSLPHSRAEMGHDQRVGTEVIKEVAID